jgi:glycosyltransferase involved in cell wall biosynthesis
LAIADVFALPSFSENFGIAAVEALLAGLPCVARLGVTHDPQTVAQGLERILENDDMRHEMGKRALRFAEREYSTRVMAERLIILYEEVCDPKRSRSFELSRPDHRPHPYI